MDAFEQQVAANQLDAALVLGPSEAICLSPGAEPAHSTFVPRSNGILGGTLLTLAVACTEATAKRIVASPNGIRTRVTGVKGRRPDHWTTGTLKGECRAERVTAGV